MPNNTVILVPGILGSELIQGTFGPAWARVVWLNPARLLAGGMDLLRLQIPDDPDPPVFGRPILEGGPLPAYYGILGQFLSAAGWNVVSPDADWRFPIGLDGTRLLDVIRQEARTGPVRILCHSRGGLLTRYALGVLAGAGQLGLVSRVVGMGVPHTGSASAIGYLGGYHSFVSKITSLGSGILGAGIRSIRPKSVYACLASWQSFYELLPAPDAAWFVGGSPSDLYDPELWQRSPVGVVSSYLAAALARWGSLPAVPVGIPWVDIVGYGVPTPKGVVDITDVVNPDSYTFTTAGDGTVPEASAHQGSRRLVRTPTAHDLLPTDGRIWAAINSALAGTLDADVTIEGPVLSL